jgi:hypothetical protein
MRRAPCRRFLLLAALVCVAASAQAEPTPSDDYLRGYADATLRSLFDLDDYRLQVEQGAVRVELGPGQTVEADTLVRALLAIEGVRHVEVRGDGGALLAERSQLPSDEPPDRFVWDLFPPVELFPPLLADPRWPHFSASYERYISDNSDLRHVGDVSFGETFALLRRSDPDWGIWELGFLAGVFSVFDLGSPSFDLVNTDFMAGFSLSYQLAGVTSLLRLYHQSSHLGDEFLLRNRVERVNLSFEVLDLLFSMSPTEWLRLYGGGGAMVHREPSLDRGLLQAGFELQSPTAFLGGRLRPLGGADFQLREESDWRTDLSSRMGFQIEHPRLRRLRLRLQILLNYYRGRSPNGQFYNRRIENVGVGVHMGF